MCFVLINYWEQRLRAALAMVKKKPHPLVYPPGAREKAINPSLSGVTASWVVAGIDRVTILTLIQSAVCNETKYRRLRLSCCSKLLTISQLPSSSYS